MSVEANKALIRFLIEEGLNKGNLDVADEYFTPEYVVHVPGRNDLPGGPASFKRMISMWRNAFPDFHMTIEALIGEGDLVSNRFTTRGTHQAPLMGIPPTGRPITVRAMEFHRIEEGKVAETWISDDVPGILIQLGIIEPPRPGPPGQ